MKNITTITKYAVAVVLALGVVLGVSTLQAAWGTPPSSPPDGNVSAPLNVGLNTQSKLGQLLINTDSGNPYAVGLAVFGKTILNGGFQFSSSTAAAGKVLTSDASGNASWQTVGGSGAPLVVTVHGPYTTDQIHVIGTHDYCALTQVKSNNENHGARVYLEGGIWKIDNYGSSDEHTVTCFDGNISGNTAKTKVLLDDPVVVWNPRGTVNFPTSVSGAPVAAGSGTIQAGVTPGIPAGATALLLYGNIDDNSSSATHTYIRYKHPSQTNWKRLTYSSQPYYSTNNSVWIPLDSSGRVQWETKAETNMSEVKLEIQGYEI